MDGGVGRVVVVWPPDPKGTIRQTTYNNLVLGTWTPISTLNAQPYPIIVESH